MKNLRILCSSDWHLDSPFEGLNASKARLMRDEQSAVLDEFVRLANSGKIDLVLLSGDLFSSRGIGHETGEQFVRSLRSVNVPVFIAPGESDPYSARCPYTALRLPENVHVFSGSGIECAELPELNVKVFGAAYTEDARPSLDGFSVEKTDNSRRLLCLYGEYALESSGFDFASLGGRHSASGLEKADDTWYVYPGCPQGRSFDECGEKTVSIVELGENGCFDEPYVLTKRQYKTMDVDLTGREALLALHTALPDDILSDIYRITLTGECAAAPDLALLRAGLAEMFFELDLADRTHIPASIWDKAQDNSLRGIFLRKLREKYDSTEDIREKEKVEQAVRRGLDALNKGKEVADHDDQ